MTIDNETKDDPRPDAAERNESAEAITTFESLGELLLLQRR